MITVRLFKAAHKRKIELIVLFSYFSNLVPRTGFEPVTLGLEVLCSIQLSYRGVPAHVRVSVIIPAIYVIIDMK